MKLTWGRLARHDLKEIVSYIAEDSLYAAELVATRVLKTAGMLRGCRGLGEQVASKALGNYSCCAPPIC